MSYLDTNARTSSPTSNETFKPLGRLPTLNGVYLGWVKDANDIQKMGRLQAWIPEFGSAPDDKAGWITVSYCSPFAGATNVETASKTDFTSFNGTQTSYGMWMVPPDVNSQIIIMFINGDLARGIWIGSLYNQFINSMTPGVASDTLNPDYPDKVLPLADYNKWNTKITQPDTAIKPINETKFKGIGNQGLINDRVRGVRNSSARREAPSKVFGISTPGPAIDNKQAPGNIRRKGGSSFVMDDSENSESIQLSTKSGAQITLNETTGDVYVINRDGTAWVQMNAAGDIEIFGARNISMRAQKDFNIRADRNVNIEAGQNVFIKAAKDTKETNTTFTYNINNDPKVSNIPVWEYKGEGKGDGGNIVMQALKNTHTTAENNAYITVKTGDFNIKSGKKINIESGEGQNFKAASDIKMSSVDSSVNIKAKSIKTEATDTTDIKANKIRIETTDSTNIKANSIKIETTDTTDIKSSGTINVSSINQISIKSDNNAIISAGIQLDLTSDANTNVNAVAILNLGGAVVSSIAPIYTPLIFSRLAPYVPMPPPIPNQPGRTSDPLAPEEAAVADPAQVAEIKPLNPKINILATWKDEATKFTRNSAEILTTLTGFPTYEPYPEHPTFTFKSISGYTPTLTEDDETYEGSGSWVDDNTDVVSPPASTSPGSNNTEIKSDSDSPIFTKDFNMEAFKCQIKIHEGVRYVSYSDTKGLPTGGIGHLLRKNETEAYPIGSTISKEVVEEWFIKDAASAIKGAQALLGIDIWADLSDVRKRACADLCYNLGKGRLSGFVKFLRYMKSKDYNKAGEELVNSDWFVQVKTRGVTVVNMITKNIDGTGCGVKYPG